MPNNAEALPLDLAAAHAMILAERTARLSAESERDASRSSASSAEAFIVYLKLEIEKLKRALFGVSSERKQRLLDQLELQLEDAEAAATEDELAAERSARFAQVKSFERMRPSRKPFPCYLPRERVVIAGPSSCPCCGSNKLSKLGESLPPGLTRGTSPRRWRSFRASGR